MAKHVCTPKLCILPDGSVYSEDQLNEYADWCIEHGVHMVVNEIYTLSRIDTSDPDLAHLYPTKYSQTSFLNIMGERKSDYLHFWYAVSKDFGLCGFRLGIVYSLNKAFIKAYN